MVSFWLDVNCTPARPRAVTPLTGSFSALPTIMALLPMSLPSATERSAVALVARSKILSGPALLILVKVSSRFCAPWTASSCRPVCFCSAPAMSSMCCLVTPAAPPVDLIAAAVCAETFCASENSRMPVWNALTSPCPTATVRPAAPPARRPMPTAPSFDPRLPKLPAALSA